MTAKRVEKTEQTTMPVNIKEAFTRERSEVLIQKEKGKLAK